MSNEMITQAVVERYATAARDGDQICVPDGYDMSDLATFIPEPVLRIANGCGVPAGIGTIRPAETVLDIGCGGGIDCFEASRRTGPDGRVIGVDMTEEMLDVARSFAPMVAANLRYEEPNVEFRHGRAEELPVEDRSIDLVISNCVINLSPDKERVFREMSRVLRPGGRFTISDIVADAPVPNYLLYDVDRWGACLSGALYAKEYFRTIRSAGFLGVHQMRSAPWKVIDGVHFYALTITGYALPVHQTRGPNASLVAGYATLVGPFLWAVDEFNQRFTRGQWQGVDQQTWDLLHLDPFKPLFLLSEERPPAPSVPSGDPRLIRILPKDTPCVWQGHFATLTSLFQEAEDDDHHHFQCGVPLEICSKTLDVLSSSPYARFFSILNRAQDPVTGEPVECSPNGACC